jgi:hypothetical protein
VIFGDVLHEGEKDKIIQPNDTITSKKNQHDSNKDIPHDETEIYSGTSSQSTPKPRRSHDVLPEPEPNTGRGMRARLPPGAYRALAKGTNGTAATTYITAFSCDTELDDKGLEQGGENNVDKEVDDTILDPLYALTGSMGNEPWLLDEALRGPNAQSWNDALKYEINQLKKLHTWSIVD